MIDFANASFLKMRAVSPSAFAELLLPFLSDGEEILYAFQSVRDGVVFTDRRIIAINVQGVTGKKKDLSTLPYNKIQAFAVETSGVLDLDSELVLWYSSLGQLRFEFLSGADIAGVSRLISSHLC